MLPLNTKHETFPKSHPEQTVSGNNSEKIAHHAIYSLSPHRTYSSYSSHKVQHSKTIKQIVCSFKPLSALSIQKSSCFLITYHALAKMYLFFFYHFTSRTPKGNNKSTPLSGTSKININVLFCFHPRHKTINNAVECQKC